MASYVRICASTYTRHAPGSAGEAARAESGAARVTVDGATRECVAL